MTIQHSCVATPATGRTDNSASSTSSITSAQAEAETLNLSQRRPPGLGPEPAHAAQPGLHDEPTVMVNRALGRPAGTSTLGSLRQGPRRLGMLSVHPGNAQALSSLVSEMLSVDSKAVYRCRPAPIAVIRQKALKGAECGKPNGCARQIQSVSSVSVNVCRSGRRRSEGCPAQRPTAVSRGRRR